MNLPTRCLPACLLLLAACERSPQPDANAGSEVVLCAPAGASELRPDCTVARDRSGDGLVLTLVAPDGAFRRLRVVEDGRGVVAADGAEPARVSIVADDRIEVAIGSDRYILPAHLK